MQRSKRANAMLLTCVLIFLGSAYQLYSVYKVYATGDAENLAIKTQVLSVEDINTNFYWKYAVDFEALDKRNSDVVAWVRFDQPEIISYAVVQTDNNSYYLNRTLDHKQSIFGTIFMDRYNDCDFTNSNTVLYGHNMKNGSMFGSLNRYIKEEFYIENPYFYIYTPDGYAHKYHIFATQEVASDSWHYKKYFKTFEDYRDYLEDLRVGAYYGTDVQVPINSKIVTLSTCTASDSQRLIVQGVKIEEREVEISE